MSYPSKPAEIKSPTSGEIPPPCFGRRMPGSPSPKLTSSAPRDCIAKALPTMEGFEVPLAAWRVHATAAEVHARSDTTISRPDRHREISRATIMKLANSLGPEEPLRTTFLSAPSVSKVLRNAQAIAGTAAHVRLRSPLSESRRPDHADPRRTREQPEILRKCLIRSASTNRYDSRGSISMLASDSTAFLQNNRGRGFEEPVASQNLIRERMRLLM